MNMLALRAQYSLCSLIVHGEFWLVFHVSKDMFLLSKETFSRDVSYNKRDISLET